MAFRTMLANTWWISSGNAEMMLLPSYLFTLRAVGIEKGKDFNARKGSSRVAGRTGKESLDAL